MEDKNEVGLHGFTYYIYCCKYVQEILFYEQFSLFQAQYHSVLKLCLNNYVTQR